MSIGEDIQKAISTLPVSIAVDRRLVDIATNSKETVDVLIGKISVDLGIEEAQKFADLVIFGKLPDNGTALIEWLSLKKENPSARQALDKLTHAQSCANCERPNTWHPDKG